MIPDVTNCLDESAAWFIALSLLRPPALCKAHTRGAAILPCRIVDQGFGANCRLRRSSCKAFV
jgi:hypothetical protein